MPNCANLHSPATPGNLGHALLALLCVTVFPPCMDNLGLIDLEMSKLKLRPFSPSLMRSLNLHVETVRSLARNVKGTKHTYITNTYVY